VRSLRGEPADQERAAAEATSSALTMKTGHDKNDGAPADAPGRIAMASDAAANIEDAQNPAD